MQNESTKVLYIDVAHVYILQGQFISGLSWSTDI